MDSASAVENAGAPPLADAAVATSEEALPRVERRPQIDWTAVVRSAYFVPVLLLLAATGMLFWDLIDGLPKLWNSEDGYYSHGWLVPLIAGYVVYRRWPKIRSIPVKGAWLALIPLAAIAYITYVTTWFDINAVLALSFLVFALAAIWFVAGWKWMVALSLPVLYLGFALPLWTGAIDLYTNPLQIYSTQVAYKLLQVFGFDPYRSANDPTAIHLSNFTMDIAVPCSGLKLILAVSAFTAFFMMIANLRWWGNLAMAALILPLCLFINGLRISLIGVVGDTYGEDAGMAFHDYSGYITLLVCFFLLFKIARGLGWKD